MNFVVSCAPSIVGMEETLLILKVFTSSKAEDVISQGLLGDIWDVLEAFRPEKLVWKKYGVCSSRILEFGIVHVKLFLVKTRGENLP